MTEFETNLGLVWPTLIKYSNVVLIYRSVPAHPLQSIRSGSPGYTGGQYSEAGPAAESKMAMSDFGSFRPAVRDRVTFWLKNYVLWTCEARVILPQKCWKHQHNQLFKSVLQVCYTYLDIPFFSRFLMLHQRMKRLLQDHCLHLTPLKGSLETSKDAQEQ